MWRSLSGSIKSLLVMKDKVTADEFVLIKNEYGDGLYEEGLKQNALPRSSR